jgi:hypothetical protein
VSNWADLSREADHRSRGVLLSEHARDLSDLEYWTAVAEAWQDSDRQPLIDGDWRRLFTADRPRRERLMTAAERTELAALPERVPVHRGVNRGAVWANRSSGLSWTLDPDVAHWFAMRFSGLGFVVNGTVLRGRVIALFQDRHEHEIVALPQHVYARSNGPPDAEAAARRAARPDTN